MKQLFKQAKEYLSSKALYLFLLPLFFVINGYNQLFGFIPVQQLLITTGIIYLFIIVFFAVTRFLFKVTAKASVFTFVVTLLFLLFGFIHDTLKNIFSTGFVIRYTYLLPALCLILVLIFIYLYRSKKNFRGVFLYLNTLFICFFLFELYGSWQAYRANLKVQNLIDPDFSVYKQYKPATPIADSSKPDIYFLVFDELASSSSLKDGWNINNFALDTLLAEKGFYVVPQGHSNYGWSLHSMASTFNMTYIADTLVPQLDYPRSYIYSANSILRNSLMSILEKEGYTIHQYQNLSFDVKEMPENSVFSEIRDYHFFYKTLPGRIHQDIYWKFRTRNIAKRIETKSQAKHNTLQYTINKVKKSVSTTGSPKFIYGHFFTPHDPVIYDSTGMILPVDTLMSRIVLKDKVNAYRQELYYTNKIIEDLVLYIQSGNKKNTVIIVAGDHGFRYYQGYTIDPCMYKNFNAIYFPDGNYQALYPAISSVNTFRVVLNEYFKTSLPLLKDTSFYIPLQTKSLFVK
jgi:hypothetical protein